MVSSFIIFSSSPIEKMAYLGCPQDWAYHDGIGSFLLRQPDTVRDVVRSAKARVGSNYPISIKIRIDKDMKYAMTFEYNQWPPNLLFYRRTDQLIQTGGIKPFAGNSLLLNTIQQSTPASLT